MKKIEDLMEELKETFEDLVKEHGKAVEKNNKAAARRARISSNKITKLLKEYRRKSVETF